MGRFENLHHDKQGDENSDRNQEVVSHEVTDIHHDLRQHRQRRSIEQFVKNLLELRNDEDHQKGENSDRDPEDNDRIDHGGLYLTFNRNRLLHEPRETIQNHIEHPARLTGFHHIHIKAIEDFRVLQKSIGKGVSRANVFADLLENELEADIFLLSRQNFETPKKGQTGLQQCGKLTGNNSRT